MYVLLPENKEKHKFIVRRVHRQDITVVICLNISKNILALVFLGWRAEGGSFQGRKKNKEPKSVEYTEQTECQAFSPVVRTGTTHPPSHRRVCPPPPPPPVPGRGAHTPGGEEGVPIPTREQTMWYSRYICTLWSNTSTQIKKEKDDRSRKLDKKISFPHPSLFPVSKWNNDLMSYTYSSFF